MPSFAYERDLKTKFGYTNIAGIDEAGRGPLAGPVFAAAVVMPLDYSPEWLEVINDSKKLSEKKRELLFENITTDPQIQWSIGQASVKEIDEINILQATYLAMSRSALGLSIPPDHCLIDGKAVPEFIYGHTNIIKGDSKSYSIAAASILAKVARDRLMKEVAIEHPEYQFHKHKGYGTKIHLEALQEHGPCPHHRLSFAPVARSQKY